LKRVTERIAGRAFSEDAFLDLESILQKTRDEQKRLQQENPGMGGNGKRLQTLGGVRVRMGAEGYRRLHLSPDYEHRGCGNVYRQQSLPVVG